jgi:hypothetical protein
VAPSAFTACWESSGYAIRNLQHEIGVVTAVETLNDVRAPKKRELSEAQGSRGAVCWNGSCGRSVSEGVKFTRS